MKKLLFIPLIFTSLFASSQVVDTVLGVKGKLIKDTALQVVGNYLFTPTAHSISFDSTKLIWFLNGTKVYTDFAQVGIGSHTPRARFMISDSTSTNLNDSTGILLTNDTTLYSPPITFSSKASSKVVSFMLNSVNVGGTSGWMNINRSINGAAYVNVFTLDVSGNIAITGKLTTGGGSGSVLATSVSSPQFFATSGNLFLTGSTGGWGVAQSSSFGPSSGTFNTGGVSIAPSISSTGTTTSSFYRGFYFNPTLTQQNGLTVIGFQNEVAPNLFNSTRDNSGFGVTSVNPYAKVEIASTAQGFLPPRMTQSQRDSMARPITSVSIISGGTTANISKTNVNAVFSAGAITALGTYNTNSSGAVTSITVTNPGAYGAGQTPITISNTGSATFSITLGASSPPTGLTIFCTDCTANDSSTGVNQTYNGSTWKNAW